MSALFPDNLGEVLPLRFRVRSELRFEVTGDHVIAERLSDQRQFSLSLWQLEVLRRFDGIRTFGEASREAYRIFPREFTALDLFNFYRWLNNENLVVGANESIFELVEEDSKEDLDVSKVGSRGRKDIPSSMTIEFKEWQFQALKISAAVIFCLCIFRIAYVIAPLFEPPVDLTVNRGEGPFALGASPKREASRELELPETNIKERELAAMAKKLDKVRPLASDLSLELAHPPVFDREEFMLEIADLRRQLAESQIRRDEFYIQNQAVDYRQEVTRMTELLKQIYEIESRL